MITTTAETTIMIIVRELDWLFYSGWTTTTV